MKDSQKEHFETAYRTGSDIWSHIPYQKTAEMMLPVDTEDGSMVLDIGAGRGLWVTRLVGKGLKVLGIDYVKEVVDKANKKLKSEGMLKQARFVVGNALDIPFADNTFQLVTDIGTFQHIEQERWPQYVKEVVRILTDNGYYLNVSLSKRTPQFLGWSFERNKDQDSFEKFGVLYNFFTEEEIRNIFSRKFDIVKQITEFFDVRTDPGEKVALVFSLMRKK